MINFKLKAHIDESSVSKLLDSLSQEQRNNLTAEDIMWKVSEAYSLNDETYVPIHAIGIKLKTQLSDAESRQVLEQSPLPQYPFHPKGTVSSSQGSIWAIN